MVDIKFTSEREAGIEKDRKEIHWGLSCIQNGVGRLLNMGGGIHSCSFYCFASQLIHYIVCFILFLIYTFIILYV